MRHRPEPPPVSHQPTETRVNTVTVECSRTGPEQLGYAGEPYNQIVLADVEGWCAELRRLGAADDLVLPEAEGLTVTLDGGQ